MKSSYSIGEFSQVTGLSVKTLRFYHEKGILVPSSVDETTGYRFYDSGKIEKARVIMRLRAMEFSIEDIATVLGECSDEADVLNYLERQKNLLQQRIREDRDIVRSLDEIIAKEKSAKQILESNNFAVEEKVLEPMLVAGIRMKGKYSDCGAGFARLGKAVGRYICGKALCLYYDAEYRDDDANFEPCFPIRKEVSAEGVSIRTLNGGRCLSLIHRGSYDQLGRSYAKILKAADGRQGKIALPTREIYLKGPGNNFQRQPKKLFDGNSTAAGMSYKRKTWREKLADNKGFPKVIDAAMSKRGGTGTFVIPAPTEVDELMRRVPKSKLTTIDELRRVLAQRHGTTTACPITTGIFAWIAAHAAVEAAADGLKNTTPYWRTLKSKGELNPKYHGSIAGLKRKLSGEGHKVIQKGKRFFVKDFQRHLAAF